MADSSSSKVVFIINYEKRTNTAVLSSGLTYIATRPGVDKTIPEKEMNEIMARAELDEDMLHAKFDEKSNSKKSKAVSKIGEDEITTDKDISEDMLYVKTDNDTFKVDSSKYLKYITERPGSDGLFNKDGKADLEKTLQEIRERKEGFVWRSIISIREDDAASLQFDKDKWLDYLNRYMPELASKMNIDLKNFKWVAAYHKKEGHPHCHLMIWENEPERVSGKLSVEKIRDFRKMLTSEIFKEERFGIIKEKDTARDNTLKDVKDSMQVLLEYIKNEKVIITPVLYDEQAAALTDKLKELSGSLPEKGRVTYKLMPPEIKEKVMAVVSEIEKNPDFRRNIEKYINSSESLSKMYGANADKKAQVRENARNDIEKRLANIVLKTVSEVRLIEKIFNSTSFRLSEKCISEGSEKLLAVAGKKELVLPVKESGYADKSTMPKNGAGYIEVRKAIETAALLLSQANYERVDIEKILNKNSDKNITGIISGILDKQQIASELGRNISIFKADWQNMFKYLDMKEDEIPAWIPENTKEHNYKAGENGLMMNAVQKMWNGAFSSIINDNRTIQAKAEMSRRQNAKMAKNKAGVREANKKRKENSLINEEMEM